MPKKKLTYNGKKKNIVKSRSLHTIIEEDENDLENDIQDVISLTHFSSINTVLTVLEVGHNHNNDHPYVGHPNIGGESFGCCIIS